MQKPTKVACKGEKMSETSTEEIKVELDQNDESHNTDDSKEEEQGSEESEDTSKKTEEKPDASDYLGESANASEEKDDDDEYNTYKKRYQDSSREALKFKEGYESLVALIESDDELAEIFEKKYGKGQKTSPELASLASELQEIKTALDEERKSKSLDIISEFEKGKGITKEMRLEMQKIVKPLVKEKMPLKKALGIAWKALYEKDNSREVAEEKENESATYSTSNSVKKVGQSITLTSNEISMARKMGIKSDEELKKFAIKLREVRERRK